jgi:hypothetical protein
MSIMPLMACRQLTQHTKGQQMNTPTQFTITDIIDSLLNDRHDNVVPVIPDGLIDLSPIAHTLRTLSKDGRALYSDENYSIAEMLGQLLQAFIPDEPNNDNLTAAILGLIILFARVLREVPETNTHMSIEEFLIGPSNQDDLIGLARTMSATPLITTKDGRLRINIAQFGVFHTPVTITDEAINGFISRQIEPFDTVDLPVNANIVSIVEPDDFPVPSDELIADPLNGFDEFFDAYFDRPETDDDTNNDL